jgi:putative membrane protein
VPASRKNRSVTKGLFAGMIAGLVASWTMNRFQSGLSRVEQAWEKSAHRPRPDQQSQSSDEPATAKMARKIAGVFGRDLNQDQMKISEPLVHYGYGTLAGGLYGALAELTPFARRGTGTAYATALWLFGDEIAVPKLGLSKPFTEYPAKVHARALAGHVVYGVTTEEVRRAVRALLAR